MEIAKRIEQKRTSRGLTRADLAERAKVSHVTIWKIEKGQVSPCWKTLEKITKALGYKSVEKFLEGK